MPQETRVNFCCQNCYVILFEFIKKLNISLCHEKIILFFAIYVVIYLINFCILESAILLFLIGLISYATYFDIYKHHKNLPINEASKELRIRLKSKTKFFLFIFI